MDGQTPYDPYHPWDMEDEEVWPEKKEWDEPLEELSEEDMRRAQKLIERKAQIEAEYEAKLDRVGNKMEAAVKEGLKHWAGYRDYIVKGKPLSEFSDEEQEYIKDQIKVAEERKRKARDKEKGRER